MNVKQLLESGINALAAEEAEAELGKAGTLRGGSVGCLVSDSGDFTRGYEIIGKCARETLTRYLGYSLGEKTLSNKLMFAGGHGNEAIWTKWLSAAGVNYQLEQPISWTVDGVTASGRPDIIIYDDDGQKPLLGLELKQASALRTASLAVKGEPKLDHLIQAGNYSYRLGDLPYQLWYTNYVNFTGKEFQIGGLPEYGTPGSEWITHSAGHLKDVKKRDTGKMKKEFRAKDMYSRDQGKSREYLEATYGITHFNFNYINPFLIGFEIRWSHDTLEWRRADTMDKWTTTPITKKGIDAYYQLIVDSAKEKRLPKRFINVDAFGTVEKWSLEKYSNILHISDMVEDLPAEKQFDTFVELLKAESTK